MKNEEIKTVSAEQWQIVMEGMAGTLRYGTAAAFAGKNMTYTIAGKTGTAQVFTVARNQSLDNQKTVSDRLRDHSWFIAFAPAEAAAHRRGGDRGERRLRFVGRLADRAQGDGHVPARRQRPAQSAVASRARCR